MSAPRIDPQQARRDIEQHEALLVCAYDSQEKFEKNHLEGALPLSKFQSQEESLSKDREVIFYCA